MRKNNSTISHRTQGRRLASMLAVACVLALLSACSLTRHLPEGEVLYTGVDHIDRHAFDTVAPSVDEQLALALEVLPNSALLGSAYHMSPLPWGLWIYNGLYTDREKGLRHWLWNKFKSDPTLVSQVNPRLRAQAAEAVLKDEGYFDAVVKYDTVFHSKDSLRARLSYDVTYHHHSRFGRITYLPSRNAAIDSIVRHTLDASLLHPGDRFSASALEGEKVRIAKALNDSGYFFFQPDFIKYVGDSTLAPNTVELRVLVGVGADAKAFTPCRIDSVFYKLDYGAGLRSQNHDTLGFVCVGFNGPRKVKAKYLSQALGFRKGALYTPDRIALAKTKLSRLNIFKFTNTSVQTLPSLRATADSSLAALPYDTTRMMLRVDATYNYPWSGTTEIGTVYKDNNLVGPGITMTAQRRNLFGGGEFLTGEFTGAYEWMTGHGADRAQGSIVNSWELGAKLSLSVPRLQLPRILPINRDNPVSSRYSLSFDWIRRAGLFEMIKASLGIDYGFSLGKDHTFTFTPLRLSYVATTRTSERFDQMVSRYPSLQHSFEDQFIPQVQLSWTYDNAASRPSSRVSRQYLNLTVAEAGGLCDLATGWWGSHRAQGERQLLFRKFSQFVKAQFEFRHTQPLNTRLTLASRVLLGAGYAYGNSSELPYTESFYIGGANSLRGFAVRGVGPGANRIMGSGAYSYLNRVGDYKIEANTELRFPIAGSLNGALFVDAGNIWAFPVRGDNPAADACAMGSNPLEEFALDTGLGFRLDLGMLVLRFDVGVPLHDPNSDGAYFNCRRGFFRHLGYNLAVGYPF